MRFGRERARRALLSAWLLATLLPLLPDSRASTFTNLQVLWSFPSSNATAYPYAPLLEGSDGFLYGTTSGGLSVSDLGAVFKLDKAGSNFMVLHRFASSEGDTPASALIEATNGVLYGTTWLDGTNNGGSIFKINKDGSGFAVLHYFTLATNDGGNSVSALLQGSDGQLYGTAQYGGTAPLGGDGVVFKMDLAGSNFMVLHSFTGSDGVAPQAPLIEGTNGALYGTTYNGGISNVGTIFRVDKDGNNFSVIHHFTGGTNDGASSTASLLKGPNGKFYGTSSAGGTFQKGVIFNLDYNGSNFMVLHHLGANTTDSLQPSSLIQGPDGVMYGTSYIGGASGRGTVFGLNPDGSGYAVFIRFANTNGANPNGLITGSDGALYGTCNSGSGPAVNGTVFRLRGLADTDVLSTPLRLGNGWRISGHGISNRIYNLQYATNISAPVFWMFLGNPTANNLGDWQFDDLTNSARRFYRTSYP